VRCIGDRCREDVEREKFKSKKNISGMKFTILYYIADIEEIFYG
jgi:hypothetical protein